MISGQTSHNLDFSPVQDMTIAFEVSASLLVNVRILDRLFAVSNHA